MKIEGSGKLVRVFVGESDRWDHKPLYEAIVLKARERGLAGATVVRGFMGFGAKTRVIHTAKILRLSEDLPMIVEIVDCSERIDAFLPELDAMVGSGLITVEDIQIRAYRHDQA